MPAKIEISHRTIIFTAAFVMLLWFFGQIREIIYLLFVSFIIMSAIRPFVDKLEKYRIPRAASILFVYLVLLSLFSFLVSALIPPLVSQSAKFIDNMPRYEAIVRPYISLDLDSLFNQFAPIGENIFRLTVGVFSNVLTVMSVLVVTFYLILERNKIDTFIRSVFDKETGQKLTRMIESVEQGLGSWLRGMMVLMVFVGLLTYGGLVFLRLEYAVVLAIIAGLLEIVPVIGPFISAVPAVLVALTVSPLLALATAALFFIVQQVENNLIVPLVMNRAVGVSPLVLIVALMIGSKIAGTMGAILAIPVVVTVKAIFREYFLEKK